MASRKVIGIASAVALLAIYLFQQFDLAGCVGLHGAGIAGFILNRTFRFLLNDGLTIALIYSLFGEKKYVLFAFYVQLAGLFFVLLPYFILKVYYPTYNGPLINFIHRLVLNPLLLMLLIPAFYYQRTISAK